MRTEVVTLVAIASALAFAACFDVGQSSSVAVSVDTGGSFCFETGDTSLRYADFDHDGYGDVDSALSVCDAPTTWVAEAGDCDDTDGGRHPGATETCGDGIDQDCDGLDPACPEE